MGGAGRIGKPRDVSVPNAFGLAMEIGERIEDRGTLVREGGGFALRRDGGGTIALDLHRVPVDHVEKAVRVSGLCVAAGLIEVEAIRAG